MLALMCVSLTGCDAIDAMKESFLAKETVLTKDAISVEDFMRVAAEKGLQCQDATDQITGNDSITSVTIAFPENTPYQIDFYVFTEQEYARGFYADYKYRFEMLRERYHSGTSAYGMNYSRYKTVSNSRYAVISFIENTVVMVYCDEAKKDEVDDFLKAIDY